MSKNEVKEIDFSPLYHQAKERIFRDTQYFLQKLNIVLIEENINLAKQFSEQIMNIHNEITRQHKWAFDELVKAMEKRCEPMNLQEIKTNEQE